MANIFITGATGYTGREVVRQLCEQGEPTTAHIRPDSTRLYDWQQTFSQYGAAIDTTPWNVDKMAATLASIQPDIIFHLIGTTRRRMKNSDDPHESYDSIDFGLVALMLSAIKKANITTTKFVYISSMGVKGNSKSAYMKARWKAEQAIIESGIPFTIARPAVITGNNRDEARPLEHVAGVLGNITLSVGAALGFKRIYQRYRSIDNEQLAAALIAMARDDRWKNQIVERDKFMDLFEVLES